MEAPGWLSDQEAIEQILEVGRRMYARNYVAANDGNITCRVSPDALWATPTGVSKGYMTREMLIKVDLEGRVMEGRAAPSSELKMHLRVYQENPMVRACVHAHPPAATSFAIAVIPLDRPILPEAVVQLGVVPVAPYAAPGTREVPDSIAPYCRTHNGVLLANHGALTWGMSPMQAYMRMESLEYYALVTMYTGNIIGRANELSCEQVDRLVGARTKMGITTGGRPKCRFAAGDQPSPCSQGHACPSGSPCENGEVASVVRSVMAQIQGR